MDLAYDEPWLESFLDCLTDAAVAEARLAAEAGPDIVATGDDAGAQSRLIIHPEQWRRLFKPRLKRLVDAVKDVNPDIAFFFHSCGCITDIMPDLIEAGVDIINPIQPEAMDPAHIKEEFGDAAVLWGAISVQHTLSRGAPKDVHDEVKLRMKTIGVGGGYIMTPAHLLNPDISWENIIAFFDAAVRYGIYT